MTRFVLTVALSLTATVSGTTSPADFNNQTQGKWYKAQGRNCSTKARASCNDWSKWSNTIFLSTPPVFAKTAYSFSLVETSDLGTTVGTVSATDADSGDAVTYAITAGNTKGMFAISNSTGKIIVYNFLDYETAATTTLTVQAKDSHGATGTTTVTVTTTNWFESLVTASTTTPLTGQSVTLTASTDVGSLPGAQYQWQRVDTTKNQWVNVGANTTTTTLTLTSATVATEVYRVTASFRSSNAAPSRPVTIEWQELAASITTNNPFPLSGDSKQRSATLTSNTNAPSGAMYQWEQWNATNNTWSNLGAASTTVTTQAISSSVRDTQGYRVTVTHGGDSVTADAVYVTWDLGATLRDITDALASNFEPPPTATATPTPGSGGSQEGATGQAANTTAYLSKETALLECVEDAPANNGGGDYDSFAELMTQYTGKTKTLLNTAGSNGCSTELTETWTAITTAFTSTFTTISTTGSNAASINAFLASEPGKSFKKHMLASASLTNSIEDFVVPAVAILEDEPAAKGNAGGNSVENGASGQSEDTEGQYTGLDCIPVQGTPEATNSASLSMRLSVLNCLVFFTPWQFWLDLAKLNPGDEETPETSLEAAIARIPWLSHGDLECSIPGKWLLRAVIDWGDSDAEKAACLKHDVAWGSLQAMAGDTTLSEDDDDLELDESHNPRNKFLADFSFYLDNICETQRGADRRDCLGKPKYQTRALSFEWFLISSPHRRFWGVAEWTDRNWPITREDIDHAYKTRRYVSCSPAIPYANQIKLSKHGSGVKASYVAIQSCTKIELESVQLCLSANSRCAPLSSQGVFLSRDIPIPVPSNLYIAHAHLYPKNQIYGGPYFRQIVNSVIAISEV